MTSLRNRLTDIIVQLLAAGAVLITAPILYAQETDYFFIERPKLALGASYENKAEKRKTRDGVRENARQDVRENATLAATGWAYHPNLMEYRLSIMPEWRQERFEHRQPGVELERTDSRNTSVLAYDTEATFLKRAPYSMDIFATKNTRRLDVSYVQDSDIENETWGTRLKFTNPTLPATFGFTNRKFSQTGFYASEEDRNEMLACIRHNAPRSVTELTLRHDDADSFTRSLSVTQDTSSNTLYSELSNSYSMTADDRVHLDSLLYNAQAEYDAIDYSTLLWSENLFWTHNENLLTRYTLRYNRREVDDADTEEKAGRFALTHHLYDRLTTNVGAGAAFQTFETGEEDRYDGDLGWLYQRPVPVGTLELGVSYDYGITRRTGDGNMIPAEETHVLSSATATYLNKKNADPGSVVVTNASGSVVYTRDVDYTVTSVGPDVRIDRTLFGGIADGQSVIVQFNYQFDAGYDDTRFGQAYRLTLKMWSFLDLTYSHRRLNHDITSGTPMTDPVDHVTNTFRIRVDEKWGETQFLLEREDRTDTNSSIVRSARQLINTSPMRNTYVNLSGEYGVRDFIDTNESETFRLFGSDIGWTPKWWCTLSLVCLRNNVYGDRQDMLFTELTPTVRLTYGVWTGTIYYKLKDQEDRAGGAGLFEQRFYCGVKRSLW